MRRGRFAVALGVVVFGSAVGASGEACERVLTETITVDRTALPEPSGLVVGELHPELVYAHNDSGDSARLLAYDRTGAQVAELAIAGPAVDIEDIARAACAGRPCLLVADMGDNDRVRPGITLVRCLEPEIATDSTLTCERFPVAYADGNARDAETLLVDPADGAIYIVSKVLQGESELLGVDLEAGTATPLGAHTFGALPVIEQSTTGGDIAADRSRLAIRTYAGIHEADLGERTVVDAFAGPWTFTRVSEEQGEAVGYDGSDLLTLAEGAGEPLRRYGCTATPPLDVEPPERDTDPTAEPDTSSTSSVDVSQTDTVSIAAEGLPGADLATEDGCCRVATNRGGDAPLAPLGLISLLMLGAARLRRSPTRSRR